MKSEDSVRPTRTRRETTVEDMVSDDYPWSRLTTSGKPETLVPSYTSPVQMLNEAVRRVPYRTALRYFGSSWSFAEMDAQSDALACAMLDLGVRSGERVAVQLQNVPQFPLCCLALWKIGAIGVGINPMYRRREVRGLLEDCDAAVFITHEQTWREIGESEALSRSVRAVITTSPLDGVVSDRPGVLSGCVRDRDPSTEDLGELIERYAGQRPPRHELFGEDIAMLVYTSGTTGLPKGAMASHANLAYSGEAYARFFGVCGDDEVVLGFAPFFHITGLVPVMGSWLFSAATLVLPYRYSAPLALELIASERITWTVGATTAFIAMLNVPESADADVSSLRRVLSGGAPIPPTVVEAFESRFGVTINPGYGMTETTAIAHGVPPGRKPPVDPRSGALTIGIPIFQMQARIIGDDGESVANGEPGELVLRGPGIVSGYWDRPEESARSLSEGWLLTGDIAVMDAEGWFYIVDRKKDVIIASGYKVWPREVEDVLYAHPSVREAAVVGVPDEYRGETVHAYVSLKDGEDTTPEGLIEHCRRDLAAYKAPRRVTILDELPKTVSGKILRRELRSRERT